MENNNIKSRKGAWLLLCLSIFVVFIVISTQGDTPKPQPTKLQSVSASEAWDLQKKEKANDLREQARVCVERASMKAIDDGVADQYGTDAVKRVAFVKCAAIVHEAVEAQNQ